MRRPPRWRSARTWISGGPGGYNDGSDGIAPAVFTLPASSTQILTFHSVKGQWACGSVTLCGPDGSQDSICQNLTGGFNIDSPIGPFPEIVLTDFVSPLAGVFLEDTLPVTAPPPLRFYFSNSSQGGIPAAFQTLSPLIGQVFFIGDGRTATGTGNTQLFAVPPTATHLYRGYIASCSNSVPGCYYDNNGTLAATFTLHHSPR